nr:uncharacterized protein LOC129280118 [Lytechinus pictus]
MKAIFSRNGIPDILMTDNARQFKCSEFKEFERQWEFTHITSSPMYPQSNGQAERTVQTIKNLMKKAKLGKQDPFYSILEYRNTPIDGTDGHAPAQLLNSRLLRSKLPCPIELLKPHAVPPAGQLLSERQRKQARYHDTKSRNKDLPHLEPDQLVRFKARPSEWIQGRVIDAHESPRSYLINSPRADHPPPPTDHPPPPTDHPPPPTDHPPPPTDHPPPPTDHPPPPTDHPPDDLNRVNEVTECCSRAALSSQDHEGFLQLG